MAIQLTQEEADRFVVRGMRREIGRTVRHAMDVCPQHWTFVRGALVEYNPGITHLFITRVAKRLPDSLPTVAGFPGRPGGR